MRILVVAALLAGGLLASWPGTPSAVAQTSCADLGGTVEAEQICHVHASNPTYTLDLKYPVDYPDPALTDYVAQNRDGFITVAQTQGSRDLPYEMEATTEQHRSGQAPKGTRSVVLKIFQDVGGPHPSTWYKSFNYDLATNQSVTYDTLFAPGSKPLDTIFPIVQRELVRQAGASGALIPPGNGHDPSHYQNFAITDDELIFYFAPGELLPLNAGASTVRVPRNAIPPLTV
ncbi:esterase [Mycobacterium talmoniae]|uniref:Immunogenic protein MPB64 n=1 Tax=Mycobacterium talmoniae TaxID=1858794 RepID=A0A1S1NHU1_9MYCO|nr:MULTISPECIES: esterase [Mycobacterium]OHV05386.1 hypothetical protein BKN37_05995 [Mycobacterium talmoniae]PQM47007.1 Immunogenic protein MPB64 [Mycobacterium talmoniae]TDH56642.1 DUF3298 domain-containing protein [Mycobacterium eburneum]